MNPIDRRSFLAACSGAGLGSTLLPGLLWARMQEAGALTVEDVEGAERLAGLSLTEDERELLVEGLAENLRAFERIRATDIEPGVAPALRFDPDPTPSRSSSTPTARAGSEGWTPHPDVTRPERLEDLAFWPLTRIAALMRRGGVTSVELTEMYLDRLRRHGPRLECVITLTEERASEQARRADAELSAGRDRGPLHGIPWGAKDLLAVRGYPTTWGAAPFRDQMLDEDAGVVRRLDQAGAVLVAKLALGALAMGDVWYGGRTRNPWNVEQGASGSSSGSAAAVVAGLVGFSLGSETLGSIVSPATRCGATGLRPTVGRVGRSGAMSLAWSMDKIGPLCRGAEDCALVLAAIHGPDPGDLDARDVGFVWDADRPPTQISVGYDPIAFGAVEDGGRGTEVLEVLRDMGVDPVPLDMPRNLPTDALRIILDAEAATAFDDLTRSGADDLLTRQDARAWPNAFRRSRFIPAVEYIRANRLRSLLMEEMRAALAGIDVFVTPPFAGDVLLATNLTGHPAVAVPSGFRDDGTPVGSTFVGRLWGESDLFVLAKAYQDVTGFHRRIPPTFL